MKKLFYALALLPALVFGQVANDLIWTQRKPDNSGNIQRNVSPTANAALGVDANKLPLALTAFTQDSVTGAAAVTAGGTNQNITLTPSGTGAINLNTAGGGVRLPNTATAGLQLYNTADQTTNYELFNVLWEGNVATIKSRAAGTGTVRNMSFIHQSVTGSNLSAQTFGVTTGQGIQWFKANSSTSGLVAFDFFTGTQSQTSGTTAIFSIRPFYNQASGTAANTDLKIARSETNLGSGTQAFIDLYAGTTGTTQKFTILNTGRISFYNGIATAGNGVVSVQGAARATAQTAANASVATYTVGAADASFVVSANVLVTTSSAEAFTVTCAYTDEGNTARTITLNFQLVGGTIGTAIAAANGAVPYEGLPLHIRAKAATAITIATTGTFTGATYNVEGVITKLQ